MADPLIRRAYATLEIKSRQDAPRIIEGVISTPTPDHVGDILEPLGAQYALPMALLWNHKQDEPIGQVLEAQATPAGIRIKAQIATVTKAGRLKDRIDDAWDTITAGLARGLSVGWKPITAVRSKAGGIHAKAWKWLESSVVIIPANQDATIVAIKALDRDPFDPYRAKLPAVVGRSGTAPMNPQPISEQIEVQQAELRTKAERLETLEQADLDGTISESERSERDTLTKGVEDLTGRIARLQTIERAHAIQAKAILMDPERRTASPRAPLPRVEVVSNLPKGTLFVRYAMAVAAGKGSYSDTLQYARRWEAQTPELIAYIKAIAGTAGGGSPSWGSELAEPRTLESEFIELLRNAAILGRVQGFRRVPPNVRMVSQTGGSTVNWVGETAVKPVSELDFSEAEVPDDKIACIVVLSNELIRLSSPSAEEVVRNDLTEQIAQFIDQQFFDPTVTVSAARPASITNGVSSPSASGTTADDLRADLNTALATFDATGTDTLYIATTPALARGIALLNNTLGQPEFSGMSPQGGTLLGFPVLVSGNVPAGHIILFKANEIFLADQGRVTLDASQQATLDLAGGTSPTFSLWQRNCTGIRAERWITWKKRRSSGVVAIIDTAAYAPS